MGKKNLKYSIKTSEENNGEKIQNINQKQNVAILFI